LNKRWSHLQMKNMTIRLHKNGTTCFTCIFTPGLWGERWHESGCSCIMSGKEGDIMKLRPIPIHSPQSSYLWARPYPLHILLRMEGSRDVDSGLWHATVRSSDYTVSNDCMMVNYVEVHALVHFMVILQNLKMGTGETWKKNSSFHSCCPD
jgi:hypothetical protein